MNKRIYVLAVATALLGFGGIASAQQYPMLDAIANKVVQKYRSSSCEQLWQQRGQPHSPREQEAIQTFARRSPDAPGVHRSSRGTYREQNV
jgi:hypothetical protein